MMKCLGCYTEIKESYCLACRKKLFDKNKIGPVLDFDAPKADNLFMFQEHSKHMSISGVQLKYSLRLYEKQLILADTDGQYILKPVPPAIHLFNINEAPENEHLTMQIASQVFGINTAANCLIHFRDGQPAYLTRRFDVRADGTKYLQEDFAQLTGRTRLSHGGAFKYDGNYEEVGMLIKKFVAAAMPALEDLFRIIVFNYILSNGDAHLKNFSLIRRENGEYRLTPAYDLMSTIIHTPNESDVALDLYPGDVDAAYYAVCGHYGRSDFMELAKRLELLPKRAERIIDTFLLKQEDIISLVERSVLTEEVKKIYTGNVLEKLRRIVI